MARSEPVFDCDIHVIEPPDTWGKYIDSEFKAVAPRGSEQAFQSCVPFLRYGETVLPALIDRERQPVPADTYERMLFASPRVERVLQKARRRFARFFEQRWSSAAVLAGMDQEGVDVTVLFPTTGLLAMASPTPDKRLLAAVARAYNNYLSELCSAAPKRLFGAAMISPYDIDDACREARRGVQELGFRAVFLRPNLVAGRNWYDPYYTPLWTLLEELDVPVVFHEGIGAELPHAGQAFRPNVFLQHVACHPLEMMLAAISFCGGGVLARHPRLRVGFFESNCGWVPFLLDRLDGHYEHEIGVDASMLPEPPSSYFKRQCYVACEADETMTAEVARIVGSDRLLFSTDFPHPDSKFPEALATFRQTSRLSADDQRRVLWDNPVALYGMAEILKGYVG